MPRVYSRRKGAETPPADAIYVGRPTVWGNPFIVGVDGDQGECVELYRKYIMRASSAAMNLRERARRELAGKDLVCWCHLLPCHADVLLEVANA